MMFYYWFGTMYTQFVDDCNYSAYTMDFVEDYSKQNLTFYCRFWNEL